MASFHFPSMETMGAKKPTSQLIVECNEKQDFPHFNIKFVFSAQFLVWSLNAQRIMIENGSKSQKNCSFVQCIKLENREYFRNFNVRSKTNRKVKQRRKQIDEPIYRSQGRVTLRSTDPKIALINIF